MDSRFVAHLRRLNGWRLWLEFSAGTVLATLLIVSLMDLALLGRITPDYLLTGLVAAGIVAPISLSMMSALLRALATQQQQALERSVASAQARLQIALDSCDEGILMVAADGSVLSANKRFFELWRLPPAQTSTQCNLLQLQAVLDQLSDPEGYLAGLRRLQGSRAQARDTLQCKDGRIFERYTRALDVGAEQGRIWCFRDITAQEQTRAALAEREEQNSAIVEQAGVGIDLIDAETLRFVEINEAACRMLGYTRDELVGQPLLTIQATMSEADLAGAAQETLRTGRASSEHRHRCKDGRVIDVFVSSRAIRLRGRPCLVGVWHDVTESKRFADVLARREQYQRALLDNFPFMVWLKDEQSRFLAVNEAFAKVFGWPSADALVGRTDLDIAPADLAEQYRADDRAVLDSGHSKQVEELILTDGRRTWFETFKSPVAIGGRVIGTVGFGRDITERKEAEWHLKMAVEVTQIVFWKLDLLTDGLEFDHARLPALGFEADDFETTAQGWIARVHPDDAGAFRQRMDAALQPGDRVFDMEFRLRRRDGQYLWLHTKGSVIRRGVDGRPEFAVGTSMNITERKRTETELRHSEARHQLVAEHVSDVIWLFDLKAGHFSYVSPSVHKLRGYTVEEVLRQSMQEALTPESFELVSQSLPQRLAAFAAGDPTSRTRTHEVSQFRKDGSVVPTEVVTTLIADAGGQITHIQGVTRDITERKRAQAELERHHQHLEELVEQRTNELLATESRASRILDSAADGLYGVDTAGRITFINPAACRMLGCTAAQALGRSAHALFHHTRPDGSPYPEAECTTHQAWRAGRELRVDDETYWHADGRAVPVNLACHPLIENDQIVGAVVSIVDVSGQRAATLARERALAAAESLARARSEFLANMSHEIRTPLNGVLGFARIGQRNCGDPEAARGAFEKILASGKHLLGVVNEILDFSKIEAGQLQLEATEVSIDELLDGAVQIVRERARAKGLALHVEKAAGLPARCIGDPLRLSQVLLNLLDNAVKFTETGSITLSAAREGAHLALRVTDTGIGMSAEQLESVFRPFHQADGSTTRRFGGTGLGLAICKRLLELMQGDLRVHSRPGAGSCFEARLPCKEAPPRPPAPEAAPPTLPQRPLAGVAILLAEDNEINKLVLQANLEEDGARLAVVEDGAAAVQRVACDGPAAYDVVLMDIQMPVMDGYEAARRILALAPDLPIVGQTANAFEEDRQRCLAAGMVAHIAKPIDPRELVQLLLQVLAQRRRAH